MDENIIILPSTCQKDILKNLNIIPDDSSCFIGMFDRYLQGYEYKAPKNIKLIKSKISDDFRYFVDTQNQNQILAKLYVKHRKYEHVVEIILH